MSDSVQEGQLPTEAPTTEPPAGGRQGEGGLGAGIGVVARASRGSRRKVNDGHHRFLSG